MNKYSILNSPCNSDISSEDFLKSYRSFKEISQSYGISNLTVNENLQVSRSSRIISLDRVLKLPEITRAAMPSGNDFSNLLNKLDIITSSKNTSNQENLLLEHEQLDLIIEEGCYNYVKIPVKGRRNPLKIEIRKSKGKVTTYASFFNNKPQLVNHEFIFKSESFEIQTTDFVFHYDYAFLGIFALSYSKISISAIFGKSKKHVVEEKKMQKKYLNLSDEEISFPDLKKKKKHIVKKNILQTNYQRRMLSPEDVVQKNLEWLRKREIVLHKRRTTREEKKNKALFFVNRQQIRLEHEREERFRLQAEIIKTPQIKSLLKILFILKAGNLLNIRLANARLQITTRLAKNIKVRTIQKLYRTTTNHFKGADLALLRAHKLLNLYLQTVKKLVVKDSEAKIIILLKNQVKISRPFMKFDYFIEKVQLIQSSFRRYLDVKNERMRKLIKLWDECMSFQTRRSLKKKNKIYQINVSISHRLKVLEKYYLDYLRMFREALRAHKEIFISEIEEDLWKRKEIIPFNYLPSFVVMKQVIEASTIVD